jgi:anti-sigma B factor antagonist
MSIAIARRQLDDIAVLEVEGSVTLGEATGRLRQAIRALVDGGDRRIILDLSKVPFMDSAGLGELVGAYTTVKRHGGEMKLVGVTARALELLQITRLSTLLESFPDEEAARRSFA